MMILILLIVDIYKLILLIAEDLIILKNNHQGWFWMMGVKGVIIFVTILIDVYNNICFLIYQINYFVFYVCFLFTKIIFMSYLILKLVILFFFEGFYWIIFYYFPNSNFWTLIIAIQTVKLQTWDFFILTLLKGSFQFQDP